jgi:mRNA-degrading endonuclease toxin of MazEF toxin-antitoxin module
MGTPAQEKASYQVISSDRLNSGGKRSIVLPFTSQYYDNNLHVEIAFPEGGLSEVSYMLCDYPMTLPHYRLLRFLGNLSEETLNRAVLPVMFALEFPWPPRLTENIFTPE